MRFLATIVVVVVVVAVIMMLRQADVVEEVGESTADALQLQLVGRYRLPGTGQIVPTDTSRNVPHLRGRVGLRW